LGKRGSMEDKLFEWFSVGGLQVDFLFRLDHLSAVMCLVVTGVGTLIHLYSIGYMAEDESRHRFFSYLNLFMFSMLLLVLGGNLLILFIGWEGVGLCSYLLIGFWFKNVAYAAAGRKAFVVNRIGDAGFLLAIFLCFYAFQSVDFVAMKAAVAACENLPLYIPLFTTIAICLFIGATGKSAQIPLFVWLPDAMAGPTPVSALIHAATMVTAGVYMLARTHFIFSLAPLAGAIVIGIAVLTAFVAATTALTQFDIKKVLAYSTVSQLGFMFMAAGAGAYWVAIFHVVTHAFFKACLFLGAGSVIHGCHHEQDMRQMGGLRKLMPITFWTYLISTLAIAGIAPFAGYYSKHAILSALGGVSNPYLTGYVSGLVLLANITAFLTAFYMTRSVAMTFFGEYRGHAHPHESPWLMTLPLVILAGLATVFAWAWGSPFFHYLEEVLG
ncbi:MAG: NADH-quinone oxidoreductase subunit L, partial [Bdellovibrionales bacterium]|nr:NADH-quinone oxidoreductase subunit L [Bdellovibrionales bacterium]